MKTRNRNGTPDGNGVRVSQIDIFVYAVQISGIDRRFSLTRPLSASRAAQGILQSRHLFQRLWAVLRLMKIPDPPYMISHSSHVPFHRPQIKSHVSDDVRFARFFSSRFFRKECAIAHHPSTNRPLAERPSIDIFCRVGHHPPLIVPSSCLYFRGFGPNQSAQLDRDAGRWWTRCLSIEAREFPRRVAAPHPYTRPTDPESQEPPVLYPPKAA